MKRLSEVALLFLPLQAIAGLLGMNVKIPMQGIGNCNLIVSHKVNIRFEHIFFVEFNC